MLWIATTKTTPQSPEKRRDKCRSANKVARGLQRRYPKASPSPELPSTKPVRIKFPEHSLGIRAMHCNRDSISKKLFSGMRPAHAWIIEGWSGSFIHKMTGDFSMEGFTVARSSSLSLALQVWKGHPPASGNGAGNFDLISACLPKNLDCLPNFFRRPFGNLCRIQFPNYCVPSV